MSSNDNLKQNASAQQSAGEGKSDMTMKQALAQDIHDSPQDEEKMKGETVVLDLPDVSDIPGQESIVVPQIGEMQDTTAASDDEEGVGIFGDDDMDEDTDLVMGNNADVSSTEKTLLQQAGNDMPGGDDQRLRRSGLDKSDDEGEPLNEGSLSTDVSGSDLDTSGVDADDAMEDIGEEDEENNAYSLGGDDNDNVTEGTP